MNLRELKRRAGIRPFARRIEIDNEFSPCPFHEGDGDKTFHVLSTADGAVIGTCFSRCGKNSKSFKTWNAIDFVRDFDKVSVGEAIRRITAELNQVGADDDIKMLRRKKLSEPMTAEIWKTRGRAVTSEDVAKLAASRPDSATPSAETLNATGFKVTAMGFLVCPYRLGDKFYTVKGRRLTTKDFLQENAVSQQGLFNIDAVTAGCDVYMVESELDAAVLYERGYTAVSVISATQTSIEPKVIEKLLTAGRIFLVGDSDAAGILCMDAIAKLLPAEKVYRMPLTCVKDVGVLFQQYPSYFKNRLTEILNQSMTRAEAAA